MNDSPGTFLTRRNAIIIVTALATTVAFLVGVLLFSIFTSPTQPVAQKADNVSLASNVNATISPTVSPTIQKLTSPAPTVAPAKSGATIKITPQPTKEIDLKIKGNRNSGIYHLPGCASYSRTKNNVEWFKTEEAAQAAGYRRARNCW